MEMEIRQDMEISWRTQPLLLTEGAEVLQNMTRAVPEGEDLNKDYMDVRDMILEDNFAMVGATGRNKAGKGSMLMGFYRTLKQDEELSYELQRRGIEELEIITIPFVQEREAAKLPGSGLNGASLIPSETVLPHTEWRYAHPRRISKLQWKDIDGIFPPNLKSKEEISAYLKERKKAVVVLVEASTPLVRPLSRLKEISRKNLREGPPVAVRGKQDLGLSVLFNIAVDPRFKVNCKLYFVEKGQDLNEDEESNKFRENPSFGRENEIRVVVTKDGQEVDIVDLPEEEQQKYASVLAKSMASPDLVAQLDHDLDLFEEELFQKGIIHEASDAGLAGFIAGTLNTNRFRRVRNPRFRGRKTYDMDYLLKSLVYKNSPQIYKDFTP